MASKGARSQVIAHVEVSGETFIVTGPWGKVTAAKVLKFLAQEAERKQPKPQTAPVNRKPVNRRRTRHIVRLVEGIALTPEGPLRHRLELRLGGEIELHKASGLRCGKVMREAPEWALRLDMSPQLQGTIRGILGETEGAE